MIRDAEMFYHFNILRSLARNVLRNWQSRAQRNRGHYRESLVQAMSYDKGCLLQSAFDLWREKWRLKWLIAQAEKLIHDLKERAVKHRNMFLLTEAFTHWSQSVADEGQQARVARQHILRLRYFNA